MTDLELFAKGIAERLGVPIILPGGTFFVIQVGSVSHRDSAAIRLTIFKEYIELAIGDPDQNLLKQSYDLEDFEKAESDFRLHRERLGL